ncbi:piggyBac transposable element-derived protein 2-like [Toxorhynchites rutilus septentrionalis]|uniref:piggyBac transposable element-derived protein 2-like n=1 Tax=Toxorhynchites rutilus septentrionalis TaxID=329112 RepID=UPI00247AD622|nr:piggyBac transposable element-derived protein 2-like [Toxorhynchites rutilus septentrionalis]
MALNSDADAAVVLEGHSPDLSDLCSKHKWSAVQMFHYLFDADFVGLITTETNKYALLKGDTRFRVTVPEMYNFLGIVLVSGYVKVPSKRFYWEAKEDTYNMLIANAMPRNKFEQTMKYLQFNNNLLNHGSDKLFKVRPLIEHANDKFLKVGQPLGKHFSIDEAMEPYYGRNSMKQFSLVPLYS